jgi:hypothetical protein
VTTPIDGFKVTITRDELKAHFEKHIAHHDGALKKLSANRLILVGTDGDTDTASITEKHRSQLKLLTFLVAHMPEGDSYRLSMHELDGLMVLQSLTDYDK